MCQPGWRQARTAAQQPRDLVPLRRARDRIDRDFAEPLNIEALARRIERAMALLRRGDLSVTEVCFAVGCSSLGTFSTRFTELVGIPPSAYRDQVAHATSGISPCVAKSVVRPIRNREATQPQPQLA